MPRNLSRQFVDGFDKAKVDTATKNQYTTFLVSIARRAV
jgi:hypothetical protein